MIKQNTFYKQANKKYGFKFCPIIKSLTLLNRTIIKLSFSRFFKAQDLIQKCPVQPDFYVKLHVCARLLCHIRLLVTPGTAVCQALLPMGFSRQEY